MLDINETKNLTEEEKEILYVLLKVVNILPGMLD